METAEVSVSTRKRGFRKQCWENIIMKSVKWRSRVRRVELNEKSCPTRRNLRFYVRGVGGLYAPSNVTKLIAIPMGSGLAEHPSPSRR